MATVRPPAAVVAARGTELYDRQIRDKVESGNLGRFVAIDIDTGEFEVGDDHYETVGKLRSRLSDPIVYTLKIGYPATAVIGGSLRPVGDGTRK